MKEVLLISHLVFSQIENHPLYFFSMKLSFKNFTAGSKAVCYEVKNNDNLVDSHKIALLTTFLLIINIFSGNSEEKK